MLLIPKLILNLPFIIVDIYLNAYNLTRSAVVIKKLLTEGTCNLLFIHFKLVILLLYPNKRRKVLRLNMKKSTLTCLEGMKTFILLNLFNMRKHKFPNSNFWKPSVSIYVYSIIMLFVNTKHILFFWISKSKSQKKLLICVVLFYLKFVLFWNNMLN